MSQIDVTVSIVTYNSKKVLENCIRSVIETTKNLDTEIVVVDNCSEDGSAELVKSRFPAVRLIENRKNVGFGKAHNQSFRLSKGKYFLILNPDTIIFPNAINKIVKFMDSHERVGVTGCKIYWDDENTFMFPDLRIHSLKTALMQFTQFCRYFPNTFISKWYWKSANKVWKTKTPTKVEGITGGLMMARRNVFESVSGFDENFFLFFEEHDLLRRIKKKGWDIYYLPNAEILHYFEESFRNNSIDMGAIYRQSAFYYYKKHYKMPGYLFIKLLFTVDRFLFPLESIIVGSRNIYTEVYPVNDRLIIEWPAHKRAKRYLVEISYSPVFCDRAGIYVDSENLTLKSDILKRLPNKTGFLRVIPAYDDNSMGKVIKVMKITTQPDVIP